MFSRELVEPPQSAASLFPEQADEAALHTRPVLIVHPDEPQIQAALLAVRPSFSLHDDIILHILIDLSQYEPAEHPLAPQIQIALFGSSPLIRVHSGADRQRQVLEEEQDLVEEESVL